MATKNESSYKQIFKATSVYGGVQVVTAVLRLMTSKVLALLLGPSGMGLMALYRQPVDLVSLICGLGINQSAIREVAKSGENLNELAETVKVVRFWCRMTGLIGAVVLFFLAPVMSNWSFGNHEHVTEFRVLSLMVFLLSLGYENEVLLKGRRRIKLIGKAGVFGALSGFILSIPMYYFYGEKGVVPVLILTTLLTFLFNHYYAHKDNLKSSASLTLRQVLSRGRGMAVLGFMVVLGLLINQVVSYGTIVFIRYFGDIGHVGLYHAGMVLTFASVDMVYTAMAGDFFPRISAVGNDTDRRNSLVNEQSEIAFLITTPVVLGMMTFTPLIINILLSSEFYSITTFIHWILLAVLFRVPSYTSYYVVLGSGNTKGCLYASMVISGALIVLNPLGYYFLGLKGLGMAYMGMMVCYTLFIVPLVMKKYGVRFSKFNIRLQIESLLLGIVVFIIFSTFSHSVSYIANSIILIAVSVVYLKRLNERTGILNSIKLKISKKHER